MRGEWIEVDGICEQVQKISEVDVMSFEEKYGDYLSTEQLAREFFVSTGTVNSWIRSGKLTPTVSMPFGSRRLYLVVQDAVFAGTFGSGVGDRGGVHRSGAG